MHQSILTVCYLQTIPTDFDGIIDIVMQTKRERTKESSWFAARTMPFRTYASVAILLQRYIKFSIYILYFDLAYI